MANTYPVKWNGKTYFLTDQTIAVKQGFCQWLVKRLRADAMEDFRGMSGMLTTYLDGLRARVWWVGNNAAPCVGDWLRSPDGGRELVRLMLKTKNDKGELLPVSEEELSDEELTKMIDAKESDESSDYSLAIMQIHEDANPKANGPVSGSQTTETTPTVP